jgi:hypothetical protein
MRARIVVLAFLASLVATDSEAGLSKEQARLVDAVILVVAAAQEDQTGSRPAATKRVMKENRIEYTQFFPRSAGSKPVSLIYVISWPSDCVFSLDLSVDAPPDLLNGQPNHSTFQLDLNSLTGFQVQTLSLPGSGLFKTIVEGTKADCEVGSCESSDPPLGMAAESKPPAIAPVRNIHRHGQAIEYIKELCPGNPH